MHPSAVEIHASSRRFKLQLQEQRFRRVSRSRHAANTGEHKQEGRETQASLPRGGPRIVQDVEAFQNAAGDEILRRIGGESRKRESTAQRSGAEKKMPAMHDDPSTWVRCARG